ncbi:hypothetical protein C8J57DRAFT_1511056 [Mycena rebaudengoi]|nr:hypothetical protein C8J57DRAFT_1511056 [Mycena rebaudengoi]
MVFEPGNPTKAPLLPPSTNASEIRAWNSLHCPPTTPPLSASLPPPSSQIKFSNLPPSPDDALDCGFDFRSTRSGRAFSPWQAEVIPAAFSLAAAVSDALDHHYDDDEDLSQPDSGSPVALPDPDPAGPSHAPAPTIPSIPLIPPTPPTPPIPPVPHVHPSTKTLRDKARSKAKQAAERSNAKLNAYTNFEAPARKPRHINNAVPIKAKFTLMKERIATVPGWIGLRDNGVCPAEQAAGAEEKGWEPSHTLADFFSNNPLFNGFTLVPYTNAEARPIVDRSGKVIGVEALELAAAQASLSEQRLYHRRGHFGSLTDGQTHGTGRVQPGTFVNGAINAAILATLVGTFAFFRIAGFTTGIFANWAPDVFEFYLVQMRLFYGRNPHLRRPFINSIFSACTFNLGPRTCALGHRDFANLVFGWCAITALGKFDWKKGGHLILWDCKLILEFPPGTTILIPSAAIFHSNIPIGLHEKRYSFTQYTAGALFRWITHGFQSEQEYRDSLSPEELEREKEESRAAVAGRR